ncbi:hypothetical protein PPROV_000829300 [Pycnococcus provasolii]|uniref:Uncharacterized protein n=1 Tax=Pycnococcus provasolii TaxID=41880 RepID=A0A830HRG7_9CHLO|nr:hypothetical protein PPROV_000829300 [Pycnococcus provasolii]
MAPSLPPRRQSYHHHRRHHPGGGGSSVSRRGGASAQSHRSCVLRLVRWYFLKDALLIAALGLFLVTIIQQTSIIATNNKDERAQSAPTTNWQSRRHVRRLRAPVFRQNSTTRRREEDVVVELKRTPANNAPWQLANDERVQMTLLEKAHAIYTLVKHHGDDVAKKLAVCAEYHESTTSSSSPSKRDDPSYQLWWNGAARYVGWAAPQLYATSAVGQTRFLMIPKSATTSLRAALSRSFRDLFSTNGQLFHQRNHGEGEGFYWSINSTRTRSLAVRNHNKIITQHGGHVARNTTTIPSRDNKTNLLLSTSSQPRRDLASYYGAAFTTNPIDRIIKGYMQLHLLKARRRFDRRYLKAAKNYTTLPELMQSEFPQFVDDLYNQVSSRINGYFDVHGSPMMPFFYNAFADMRELLDHDIGVAGSYRRRWNSSDIVNAVVQFVGKTENFDEDWKRMLDDRDAFIGSKNNSIVAPFANAKEVGRKNAHTGRKNNLLQNMSHVNTMDQHVAETLCASLFMDFVCLGYEFPPECDRFERAIKTNQLNRDVPLPLVY